MDRWNNKNTGRSFRYPAIGVVASCVVFFLDIKIPLGVADGMLYVGLVLLGLLASDKRVVIFAAILGSALNILGLMLSPPGGELWKVLINRSLSFATIWMTAVLCLLKLKVEDRLRSAHDQLELRIEERTAELKESNDRLFIEVGFSELLNTIALAANEVKGTEEIIEYCLKTICHHTGWSAGHLYLTEKGNPQRMLPTSVWHLEEPERMKNFRKVSESLSFDRGIGIPGRVLESREVVWIDNVAKDPNFPRGKMVKDTEVKAGFAIPIRIGENIAGALEFFSLQEASPDKELIKAMEQVGTLLGRVLERQIAQNEIDESREQLRAMFNRLEVIREEERTRIAREVHDQLGQALTAWKLDLAWLEKQIVPIHSGVSEKFHYMNLSLENTLQDVRRISAELRPLILDIMGLCEAIKWQANDFQARNNISCECDLDIETAGMEPRISTTLFRICQEALTNVSRHSKATKVLVNLGHKNNHYTLMVCDNGLGFDMSEWDTLKTFGILGIRERVLQWHGNLEIASKPGEGTRIMVRIPIPDSPVHVAG